jgi:hypothetical protein
VRQIVLADNALRTSLSTYSASQTLEAAAQTTFDSALAAYRNGVGSITDLTLAEAPLLQAKNASTDAYRTVLSVAWILTPRIFFPPSIPRSKQRGAESKQCRLRGQPLTQSGHQPRWRERLSTAAR